MGRRTALLLPVGLGLVGLLPALGAGFVHDDARQLLENPLLRDLGNLPVLWRTGVWAGAGSGSSWYRPLMTSSFALDHALFGFSAPALHAVQLALYGLVVALALRLVWEVTRDPLRTLLTGLLFAPHPLNAEPAVWISARCELLAGAGGLAALLLHRAGLERRASARASGWHAAAGLALAFGLFGKESAVGFGVAFPVLDRLHGASWKPAALLARYAAPGLALAAYALLRRAALGDVSAELLGPVPPGALLAAMGQGMRRVLWPATLSLAPPPPTSLDALLGVLVLAAAGAAAVVAVARRSTWAVPLAVGLPHLVVAALGAARVGELADRYLVWVVFATAWGLAGALPRLLAPRPALLAAALTAGLLGAASWQRARVFESDERLWTDAWRKNPTSVRAAINLAAARLQADDPRGALAWLDQAERLAPGDRQIALNRAAAADASGDATGARRILEGLRAEAPQDPEVHRALGHLALERGDAGAALHHYEVALRGLPLSAEAWAGRGVALLELGRRAEARAALERALALDPAVQNAPALRRLLEGLRAP